VTVDVFVDDQAVVEAPRRNATVADTVRHVQMSVCRPGRLVVRLRCDGVDVLADDMANTLKKNTSAFSRLELFTSTPHALVLDAMDQASTSLQETEDACTRVAELLTEGKTSEGMNTLGECLRIWQQVHLAVTKSVEMLRMDVEQITIRDEPLADVIRKPREVLVQIRDALLHHDHVLLADVLHYELSEVTHQWFAIIARVREEAESQSTT
jgi:hypothetical protein